MPIDYKSLLERYMSIVVENEYDNYSFVNHVVRSSVPFTDEEKDEMRRIEKEAYSSLGWGEPDVVD